MNIQGPQDIMHLMQGAQATGIFRTAIELGLFAEIAKGNKTAATVAKAIGCKERATRILLDACGALKGSIEKARRSLSMRSLPSASSSSFPASPTYMGELLAGSSAATRCGTASRA